MTNVAIQVENLSKRYRIGLKDETHETLAGGLVDIATRPIRNLIKLRRLSAFGNGDQDSKDIIWALRDVSFEVKEAEVVGIIGRNGAGKTTLLRILSHITEPTGGRVLLNGRVSSLLEVGTGFHPELTGRENTYLNGTVLGMSRKEIDRKFDEIVDFSGIEKFIDTPAKRYSSGMQVRLAFAVAAHLEPEILLVDEVLAVGDAEFQKKCLGKMENMASGGRTIIFVSHNLGSVRTLCERAVWLDQGRIVADGRATEVIDEYSRQTVSTLDNIPIRDNPNRTGQGPVRVVDFYVTDGQGKRVAPVRTGEPCSFVIEYQNHMGEQVSGIDVGLGFRNSLGVRVCRVSMQDQGQRSGRLPPIGQIKCHFKRFPLQRDSYILGIVLHIGGAISDLIVDAVHLRVVEGDYYGAGITTEDGPVLVDHEWELPRSDRS